LNFFGHYSYEEPPHLANYTEAALARFRNKVILSAKELRVMDTTIWKVRPKRPGDSNDEVYLTSHGLHSPVSSTPVSCRSGLILHITDPHFSVGAGNRSQHIWRLETESSKSPQTMVEAITTAVAPERERIGLIIVTGDLTFTGCKEEFDQAAKALRRLLGIYDLDFDHLIVVPGNHDIQWSTDGRYRDGAEVSQAQDTAKANYEHFYNELFGHEPDSFLSMGRRYSLPCGLTVEVCALNSSSLEQGREFLAGMGRIDEGGFGNVARELCWTEDSSLALRILATHHHVALTEDLEPATGYSRGFGIAVDAARIQRLAARSHVQLVMHGHKHRAFIGRSGVYELPEHTQKKHKLGDLSIIGGGSAGSSDTDGYKNFFNTLCLSSGSLTLDMHKSSNRGLFNVIQTWKATLSISSDGQLTLSDWETSS
jgi:3',5'-cyclic AMP phosphodiesterase CpdA